MQGYTDIRDAGWVARLPAAWRPYALLARFDRPIGAWLLYLPGLWSITLFAATPGQGAWLALLFLLGAFAMRGAGCVVNDLWDRELDRQVERTRGRPLAAGLVTPVQALLFLGLLCAVGLLVLVQFNGFAIAVGVLSLVPVVLYPLAKRVTDFPQFVLGLTFGWGALLGTAAAIGALPLPAWLLEAAAIAWILGYDTIYAHQDREDDALVGIRSTALRFGARTPAFLLGCYGATLALLVLAGLAAGLSWAFLLALSVPAGMLWRQAKVLDIHDPAQCLVLFKANREVGLLVALAILLGRL